MYSPRTTTASLVHCMTLLLALLHNVMFSAVKLFQHCQTKAVTELNTVKGLKADCKIQSKGAKEGEQTDRNQRTDGNQHSPVCYSTCMKEMAVARSRLADSPVLASRLGQVCSKQWDTSALPSPRLGISWPSSSRSSFKDAWKTYERASGHFQTQWTLQEKLAAGWCQLTVRLDLAMFSLSGYEYVDREWQSVAGFCVSGAQRGN